MPTTGFHHVAYACRDIHETVRFYDELVGYPLVHTEVANVDAADPAKGYMRHIFFDTGDGSCLAFFDLHGMGEEPDWSPAVTGANGQPVWVTHIAFATDESRQEAVRTRMSAAGIEPLMELDHSWCHSLYYLDPNGIMIEFCRDTPGFEPDGASARALLDEVGATHPPARRITPA